MISSIFGIDKQKWFKIFWIIVIIVSIMFYKVAEREKNSGAQKVCIKDQTHILFSALNRQLHSSSIVRALFLGTGQLLVDGVCTATFVLWLFKIKNFRLPAALAIYFLIRSIFLIIQRFPYPFPDTVIWTSPGIPSLLVPYEKTRDFFFSGHTGTMTIFTFQLFQLRYKTAGYISLFGLIYIIIMLLGTNGHYTSDIFTGFIFATFCYHLCKKFLKCIDYTISLPFIFVKQIISKLNRLQKIQSIQYYDQKVVV